MTLEELKSRMEEIRVIGEIEGDDEVAHSKEDLLMMDVLIDITGGSRIAAKLAREVLKVKEYDFCRWHA